MTWDVDAFTINSTVQVTLDYVNTSDNEGKLAYTSDRTPNKIGFIALKMDKAWLKDEARNNLTLQLINYNLATDDHSIKKQGPTISLTKKPVKHYPPPPPTKPNKLGLTVGLPVALVVVFAIALGLCFGMRKHRRIGLGNIMGGRKKGYRGRGRRPDRSVRLDDLDDPDRYTDVPDRSDDRLNDAGRVQGTLFRPDASRLKSWK